MSNPADELDLIGGSEEEDEAMGTWILSYGDLMTVLVVFFLIMISPQAIMTEEQQEKKEQLEETFEEIKEDAIEQNFDHLIELEQNGNTGKITFKDELLFKTAQADISAEQLATLNIILTSLKKLDGTHTFAISGHTDSVPIRSAKFPSNWYLSSMRALRILDAFVANNFIQKNLTAEGFSQYRPISPERDDDGRIIKENQAINRRVEIFIK